MLNKKLLFLLTAIISGSLAPILQVHASRPGAYLGVQGGWGQVQTGISSSDVDALLAQALDGESVLVTSFHSRTTANGLAGRIFAGFQFNCFFATEFGWTKFPNSPVHANFVANSAGTILGTKFNAGRVESDAYDLVLKGIVPLPAHVSLYGKLGYAYLEAWTRESLQVTQNDTLTTSSYKDTKHRYYPTFGMGVTYDFTPDFGMDLSYNRIQKTGGDDALGSTDLVTLGAFLDFGLI